MAGPPDEDSGEPVVTALGTTAAPWGKQLTVEALHYASGLRLARVRIREGRRFTVLDVDPATADWLRDAFARALDRDKS